MTVTALATYADLQAAMASWQFERTDLPAAVCIQLAEGAMRSETGLKLRTEEIDSTLTGVVGSRKIALPSGFQAAHVLWRELGSGRIELSQVSPDDINDYNTNGIPQYWCVDGANIAFERPCESTLSFTLRNEQYLPALSDDNPTNWLLTNYPQLYLAAANLQAAIWLQDSEQTSVWSTLYGAALEKVSAAEARAKGTAPLRTELSLISKYRYGGGYNIRNGQ